MYHLSSESRRPGRGQCSQRSTLTVRGSLDASESHVCFFPEPRASLIPFCLSRTSSGSDSARWKAYYGGPLPAGSAGHGQIVKVTRQHVCHRDREACRFCGNPEEFTNQIGVSQFLPEPVFEENWCHGREGGLEPAGQKMLCVPRGEKTVGWQLLAREGCRCWPRGLNLSWKQVATS